MIPLNIEISHPRFWVHDFCKIQIIYSTTTLLSGTNSLLFIGFQYNPDVWVTSDQTYGMKKSSGCSSSTYLNLSSGNFWNEQIKKPDKSSKHFVRKHQTKYIFIYSYSNRFILKLHFTIKNITIKFKTVLREVI